LEQNGFTALLDWPFQVLEGSRWDNFPVDPGNWCVILTHAHIDPRAIFPLHPGSDSAGQFVHSSNVELLALMLPDSGRLQEEDAAFATKPNTQHMILLCRSTPNRMLLTF
jgi:metallo-beta-lactamase family protein